MPPPNFRILIINTGLTEEQVLNSFVDAIPTTLTTETKKLNLNQQPTKLKVNVLEIWSSDDEEEGRIDLWKENKGTKAQSSRRVEKEKEEFEYVGLRKEKIEVEKEEKRDNIPLIIEGIAKQ